MIVTIHQPEHLPWLGFFDKMRQADVCVLLDTTQFAKDDFQNRNRIKAVEGPAWLTVPVFKKGVAHQLIRDVKICNDRNWKNRCWSKMLLSYRDAPFFQDYKEFFLGTYNKEWSDLLALNDSIIRFLRDQLGLKTDLLLASELGVYERGGTTVNLEICRRLGAHTYLSGRNGRAYLDEQLFAEHNIEVRYQDFHHPVYPQLWGDFHPFMSAVDLLFNCGKASLEIIAKANNPFVTQETSAGLENVRSKEFVDGDQRASFS